MTFLVERLADLRRHAAARASSITVIRRYFEA